MNYTLLIAEDEPLEREALTELFTGTDPRITNVLVADSGRKAIEIASTHQIDIAILDIRMPGVDGLEAARRIREMYRQVHIIFLTAYDYFEYARQAIHLHADDFIVKPAEDEEILRTVLKAMDELQQQSISAGYSDRAYRYVEEEFLDAAIGGYSIPELMETGRDLLQLPKTPYFALVFYPDFSSYTFPVREERQKRVLVQRVLRFMEVHLPPPGIRILSRAHSDRGYLVVFLPEKIDKYGAGVSDTVREIPETIQIGGSIGMSSLFTDLHMLSEAVVQARVASATNNGNRTGNRIVSVAEWKPEHSAAVSVSASNERALLSALLEGQSETVLSVAEQICDDLQSSRDVSYNTARRELYELVVFISRTLRLQTTERAARLQEPTISEGGWSKLRRWLHDSLMDLMNERENLPAYGPLTGRIRTFIQEHFQETITLDRIADHLGVSPTHCSREFARQTGETISRFITTCRINRARELLNQPRLSVKEIASRIGFNDANYFSRVFSQTMGVTPIEFRKQLNIIQ